jgi:hypothetical protein
MAERQRNGLMGAVPPGKWEILTALPSTPTAADAEPRSKRLQREMACSPDYNRIGDSWHHGYGDETDRNY